MICWCRMQETALRHAEGCQRAWQLKALRQFKRPAGPSSEPSARATRFIAPGAASRWCAACGNTTECILHGEDRSFRPVRGTPCGAKPWWSTRARFLQATRRITRAYGVLVIGGRPPALATLGLGQGLMPSSAINEMTGLPSCAYKASTQCAIAFIPPLADRFEGSDIVNVGS